MPNWLKKLKRQIVENHHWIDTLYMARYNKKRRLTIEPPMNYLLINIPFLRVAKLRIVVVIVDLPINIPFLRAASYSGRHKGRGEA